MVRKSIQRAGAERLNNFVVKSKGFNEISNQLQEMLTSEINQVDIKRHGLRRHEVTTNFVASGDAANTLGVLEDQRKQLRDWFGLNPYFFSGTLQLGRGFPEIHPGFRLRLLGPSEDDQIVFYVERVAHQWALRTGLKTTVTVSRGWKGSEQSFKSAIQSNKTRFVQATQAGALLEAVGGASA